MYCSQSLQQRIYKHVEANSPYCSCREWTYFARFPVSQWYLRTRSVNREIHGPGTEARGAFHCRMMAYIALLVRQLPKPKGYTSWTGKLSLMTVIITRERTARADQELARIDASIILKNCLDDCSVPPSLITIEHLVKQQKIQIQQTRLADQLCLD